MVDISSKERFENEGRHDNTVTVNSCCCTARSRYYPRLMIAEVSGSAEQTAQFMKYGDKLGAHIATNVALTNVKRGCDAQCVHKLIGESIAVDNKDDVWPNWQVLCLTVFISVDNHSCELAAVYFMQLYGVITSMHSAPRQFCSIDGSVLKRSFASKIFVQQLCSTSLHTYMQ